MREREQQGRVGGGRRPAVEHAAVRTSSLALGQQRGLHLHLHLRTCVCERLRRTPHPHPLSHSFIPPSSPPSPPSLPSSCLPPLPLLLPSSPPFSPSLLTRCTPACRGGRLPQSRRHRLRSQGLAGRRELLLLDPLLLLHGLGVLLHGGWHGVLHRELQGGLEGCMHGRLHGVLHRGCMHGGLHGRGHLCHTSSPHAYPPARLPAPCMHASMHVHSR
jgi:hypothetical protein